MEPDTVYIASVFTKHQKISPYNRLMRLVYKALLILVCLDFGFFDYKTKKRRIFLQTFTVIRCTITCLLTLYTLENHGIKSLFIYFGFYLSHYYVNVIVLVCCKPEATIGKLFWNLEHIDICMQVDTATYNLERKMLLTFFLVCVTRSIINTTHCLIHALCLKPLLPGASYLMMLTSLDLVYVSYIFVFYALSCRLKKLASILETGKTNLTYFQHIYQSIVELAKVHKTAFHPVLIIELLYSIPENMLSLYRIALEAINEKSGFTIKFKMEYFTIVTTFLLMMVPACAAGIIATQAEKIKILLHNKLMEEQDEYRLFEIQRFIRFIEAQPGRLRVYKVLPLDADLCMMIVNFCVTYIIVILQFTNK